MSSLAFREMRVLAIGAHPDDIEIGAGGFVYRLIYDLKCDVDFLILTKGRLLPHGRLTDAREMEARNAAHTLGVRQICVADFEDCELHNVGHKLIHVIETALAHGVNNTVIDKATNNQAVYDLILTHASGDTHRDHAEVHGATKSAARRFPGWILFYQAPSTVPNEFRPTMFVELSDAQFDAKKRALEEHKSQQGKPFVKAERLETIAASWAFLHRFENGRFEAFEIYRSFVLLPDASKPQEE